MVPALSDLDDADAVAVFADALESVGDPRGQLTHLQLALEQRPRDTKLLAAHARHLALHGKALFGVLATATSLFRFHWRRGFVVQAVLASEQRDVRRLGRVEPARRNRFPRLLRALDGLPVMRRLEALAVRMPDSTFARAQLGEALGEIVELRLPLLRQVTVVAEFSEYELERRGLLEAPLVERWWSGRRYRLTAELGAVLARLARTRAE